MSQPVTVEAPANIALIKYWGARDLACAVPNHASISMTLRECVARTTVELLDGGTEHEVWLAQPEHEDGRTELIAADESFAARVRAHLDAILHSCGSIGAFRIATRNSFPMSAGLASSAAGFAALSVGASRALGLRLSAGELSALARLSGSGSAARSVLGGYVEWPVESAGDTAAAELAPATHWDLRDVIVVVEGGHKEIGSLEGHRRAPTSPHYSSRLELMPDRLERVRQAIAARDIQELGPLVETDYLEMHIVAMTSDPPIYYWAMGTAAVLQVVRRLRDDGIEAYATMDAGPNVHVICEAADEPEVAERMMTLKQAGSVIRDGVGCGPRELEDALW